MAKRKSPADIRLPIPSDISLSSPPAATGLSPGLQKLMVRQAVQAAYHYADKRVELGTFEDRHQPQQLVSDEQIELVTALMQTLQPTNAIEAALAAQFAATHIRGMRALQEDEDHIWELASRKALGYLAFSQATLDNFNRFRNKGMQQINVQYNVNHGQVVNIKEMKNSNEQIKKKSK